MQVYWMEWEAIRGGLRTVRRTMWVLLGGVVLFASAVPAYGQACTTPADCDDGIACTDDICDSIFGCINLSNCSNGLFCDGIESCCTDPLGCDGSPQGACLAGVEPCPASLICDDTLNGCVQCLSDFDCIDTNPCTLDVCQPNGTCTNTVTTGACDDGEACTENDTCVNGQCIGQVIDCNAQAGECEFGVCIGGTCQFQTQSDGSNCNDGDRCTATDACQGGVCVGGSAGGCVDLELRGPIAGTVNVGDIVEFDVWALGNGCPPGNAALCPNLGQPIAGVSASVTWDPAVFALAHPVDDCTVPLHCVGGQQAGQVCVVDTDCDSISCAPDNDGNGDLIPDECGNPRDSCLDLDPCNLDCGSPLLYNWAGGGTSFIEDCNADGINAPCPGFPDNDGDAFFLNFKQLECNNTQAPPACVTPGGLLVTTLRFKAIGPTLGLGPASPVGLANCVVQTRSKVAGGDTPGEDVIGNIAPPVFLTVACLLSNDCPLGAPCVAGECSAALAPVVETGGPRYLLVTPEPGTDPVAILVTGVSPSVSCISAYVQATGALGPNPFFQLPGAGGWGTVAVRGPELVSELAAGLTYDVQVDVNPAQPGIALSEPTRATLWRWGDVNNNLDANIVDVTLVLDGFKGIFVTKLGAELFCTTDADCANVPPNFECETSVGRCIAITRENVDLVGVINTCLPDRDINIVDVTFDLDAFKGKIPPCLSPCP